MHFCFSVCFGESDIWFVIDESESIRDDEFQTMLTFMDLFVNRLNIAENAHRVGIILYSGAITYHYPLSWSTADLTATIAGLGQFRDKDGTGTDLALNRLVVEVNAEGRPGVTHIGIVMTDGESKNPTATIAAALATKNNGIIMATVSVGAEVDLDLNELSIIATSPALMFMMPDGLELTNFIRTISLQACDCKKCHELHMKNTTKAYTNDK